MHPAFEQLFQFGLDNKFGSLTRRDLDEIDLSKSISSDLQLAAEIMLYDGNYYPQIERSGKENTQARTIFAERFKKQFAPVETALKNAYLKNYEHPTDDASAAKIFG